MTSTPRRVLVVGDGGWGTALAITLQRAGHDTRLWSHDAAYAELMASSRSNPRFLPSIELPRELRISSDIADLSTEVDTVLSVVPTQFLDGVLARIAAYLPADVPVASCSKGIERGTLRLPSDILATRLPGARVAVLSGPSHAEEVSRELPSAVVAASTRLEDARHVQELFAGTRLRVYTSQDIRGVELGGAVKNVIAIATGISDGLGFGDNTRAAIITRGLVEITRLGMAMGAQRETFSGLSGMGDLITTCTSSHSRNHTVGYRVGRGESLADILSSTSAVAEGVETSRSVNELNRTVGVELPICREVFAVLHEGKPAPDAVTSLMSRSSRDEAEDLV